MVDIFEEKTQPTNENERDPESQEESLFSVDEVIIEEMAIDGICGVY